MDNHHGRELELLLTGKKPLAVFSLREGEDESVCFGNQNFNYEVGRGTLCRFESVIETDKRQKVLHIAFTIPEEIWRASAYFHIMQFLYKHSWCSHLEWIEGSLLGYSDSENRNHLSNVYGQNNITDSCFSKAKEAELNKN